MDAIGDAEYALLAHHEVRQSSGRLDAGVLYLLHYGFVQALFLQQDAVKHLCECLEVQGVDITQNPIIKSVRDTRNDVAHATNRGWGNARTYQGIVRASMSKESFELYSFSAAGLLSGPRKVLCHDLAALQLEELSKALGRVIEHLEAEVETHKEQYRSRPLEPLIAKLEYPLEKVVEAALKISRDGEWPDAESSFSLGMLDVVEKGIGELVRELEERGWFPEVHEGIDDSVSGTRRVITRLHQVFTGGAESVVDAVDVEGLARLLQEYLGDLRTLVVDLDRDYNE
jgi:hypothetical protein